MMPWVDRWLAALPEGARQLVLRAALGREKHDRFTRLLSDYGRQDCDYGMREMIEGGFIFIHVPKTAGLSVSRSVVGHRGGGHATAALYLRLLGGETFDALYKFAVVRNPYDRLASAYFFLRSGGMSEEDELYYTTHLARFPDFRSFVLDGLPHLRNPYKHLRSQLDFVVDPRSRKCCLDCTVRFENLEHDMERVWAATGKKRDLPHLNANGDRRSWSDLFDDDMKRVCRAVYQRDFDVFGYA